MYIFMLRYVQLLHAMEQNCHMIAILYIKLHIKLYDNNNSNDDNVYSQTLVF